MLMQLLLLRYVYCSDFLDAEDTIRLRYLFCLRKDSVKAFHWYAILASIASFNSSLGLFLIITLRFANKEALEEIYRVLIPGGVFGMIWNIEDCM